MSVRGPDGEGLWRDENAMLGHRRLAIIDLDSRAGQPMHSACGRYVIAYNGEIYNFRALRKRLELRGAPLHTTSDTEVIVELFAAQGPAMLSQLQGMFAFVIWDRLAKRAFAARDPYGIKPLYCGHTEQGVILASQVKALLATGMVSRSVDPHGQTGFWMLGSVPEPHTWYRDIQAVPAGHFAWIEGGRIAHMESWSDISNAWRTAPPANLPPADVQELVRKALHRSVSRHLVADVPVGVFLSGGIDSGALAGLMVEAGAADLQGITIAYDEFAGSHQDEAPVAARIAAHYGIRHHVRRVTREEFTRDLPRILTAMDQPSIDGINTWYASKAVAELGLKVVVSGVGGDELFQGYSSFQQLPRLVSRWRALSGIPGTMAVARRAADLQARRSGKARWRYLPDWARTLPGAWWSRRSLFAPSDIPRIMGADAANAALEDFSPNRWIDAMSGTLPHDLRLALSQIESTTYLRNQLLHDSDWASMDHSVELRTPLVDATLLADLQPLLSSFRQFPGKTLLAHAPARPLPRDVIARRKTGFGIPLGAWLGARSGSDGGVLDSRDWARRVASAYDDLADA